MITSVCGFVMLQRWAELVYPPEFHRRKPSFEKKKNIFLFQYIRVGVNNEESSPPIGSKTYIGRRKKRSVTRVGVTWVDETRARSWEKFSGGRKK